MERRRLRAESLSSILRGDYAERFRFRFCAVVCTRLPLFPPQNNVSVIRLAHRTRPISDCAREGDRSHPLAPARALAALSTENRCNGRV